MKELAVRQQTGIVTSSLEEVTDRFISSLDVKKNSRYTYRRALRQFTEWIGEKGITNPEREDILSYKRDLEARGLSPLTLSAYMVTVRKFFEWAEAMKYYPNIAKGIKGSNGYNILSPGRCKHPGS